MGYNLRGNFIDARQAMPTRPCTQGRQCYTARQALAHLAYFFFDQVKVIGQPFRHRPGLLALFSRAQGHHADVFYNFFVFGKPEIAD